MSSVPYHLGQFPPSQLALDKLFPLIGPAHAAIARYGGMLRAIPNAQVLLSPLTSQEAVLSSRIEGTQATLGEVLQYEAGQQNVTEDKRNDILEVLNYRRALNEATQKLAELPLCQRMLKEAHYVLMNGVRGKNKAPGEYRKTPAHIGTPGSDVSHARFVPPDPQQVPELMNAWEKYLHSSAPDFLVQLAILHVEFEAIHPFMDGNGRTGRLLVPLYMVYKELLDTPCFFISSYLEAKRQEYYDRLQAVSKAGDWTGWCVFFLEAMIGQAQENEDKVKAILSLYNDKKNWIAEKTRSQYAIKALDWCFTKPIFSTSDFIEGSKIPVSTSRSILSTLKNEGMLKELLAGQGRRPSVFVFADLLNIAEGRPVF